MGDSLRADIQFVGVPLDVFDLVSVYGIRKIITKTQFKSCELDPIPTNLLQQCLDSMLPIITEIINRSFSNAMVPASFKNAIVQPLIKRPGKDLTKLN
jgi:hypothetical protein